MLGKDKVLKEHRTEHLTQSLLVRVIYPEEMVCKLSPEGCYLYEEGGEYFRQKMELIQKLHDERKRAGSRGWALALFLLQFLSPNLSCFVPQEVQTFYCLIPSNGRSPNYLPGPEPMLTIVLLNSVSNCIY